MGNGGGIPTELTRLITGDGVRPYLADATETRGIGGRADAVAVPADAEEVRAVVEWCYEHDVPVVPRGGSGYGGGAVPDGGVVLSLERLRAALVRAAAVAGGGGGGHGHGRRPPPRARGGAVAAARPGRDGAIADRRER